MLLFPLIEYPEKEPKWFIKSIKGGKELMASFKNKSKSFAYKESLVSTDPIVMPLIEEWC